MQHGTEPQLNAPTPMLIASPAADSLLAMLVALAAEVAAVGDELESLRALLLRRELVDERTLAELCAEPEVQAARARRKAALVDALTLPMRLGAGVAASDAVAVRTAAADAPAATR